MAFNKPKKITQFPDVENKLQAPTKKSLFEKQKADAEAKRLRDEAETKAVYEEFVKSFDDEGADEGESSTAGARFSAPPNRPYGMGQGGPGGFNSSNGPPPFGRGYGGNIGRGGSGPGSLGPLPPSLNKKRTYDGFQQQNRRDDKGILAFEDYEQEREPKRAFQISDDEDDRATRRRDEEKAAAKPTLRLTSLPPGTSPAVIKALLPGNLTVDAVRILPPSGPGTGTERKSMSAIVTLAPDTSANDIDSTVSNLQNGYLGYGYYLSLHRHLSSAAISSAPISTLGTSSGSKPFGAKPVIVAPAGRGHAPPSHQRGFAPPTSYAPTGPGQIRSNEPLLHVPVQAPQDIKQLKLIHKTIESLLTHGPEFEALLMTRPSVQKEERWAWLWDSRSSGGVWYRWRLWQILTGSQAKGNRITPGRYLPLFEGSSAWKSPDSDLSWEYTTQLSEFVSDSEYNSSDEDDSGDEGPRRPQQQGGGPPDTSILNADDGKSYLNPLEKAKLTHLLSRLPTSTSKLRKGDVARVTAFAISHAGKGADEVVSLLISNIEKPFAYTSANPSNVKVSKDPGASDVPVEQEDEEKEDTSSASLIALYLISDILSSSSTSGVRHAWRYRSLFESALKSRQTFEKLGRLERKLKWGRLRAEKWKRSVGMLLGLWEGWCVFPQGSQEHFMAVFNEPPLGEKEAEEQRKAKEEEAREKSKGRWKKAGEATVTPTEVPSPVLAPQEEEEDVDGEPMEDIDGEPMEDVDGEPMEEDLDGDPMQEDEPPAQEAPALATLPQPSALASLKEAKAKLQEQLGHQRRRPRAVDMFADSDDDDDDK